TSSMTASGPFGAGRSAVPASGARSPDARAHDPVATPASNPPHVSPPRPAAARARGGGARPASNAPQLSALVTAVKKANLVDTLNTAQGITVFAPTNDAFAAVPKPTLHK